MEFDDKAKNQAQVAPIPYRKTLPYTVKVLGGAAERDDYRKYRSEKEIQWQTAAERYAKRRASAIAMVSEQNAPGITEADRKEWQHKRSRSKKAYRPETYQSAATTSYKALETSPSLFKRVTAWFKNLWA